MAIVTNHGRKRMAERAGITCGVSKKMAKRAFAFGITHAEMTNDLKKLADAIYLKKHTVNNIRFYGEKLFLFCGECLVTVINPPERIVKNIRNNIKEDAYKKYNAFIENNNKKIESESDVLLRVNNYAKQCGLDHCFIAVEVIHQSKRELYINYISDSPQNDYLRFSQIAWCIRRHYEVSKVCLVHKRNSTGAFLIL